MPRVVASLLSIASACRGALDDSTATLDAEVLAGPCGTRQVAALALAEGGEGWVGCAGGGLLHTRDAGRSFQPERGAERLDPVQLLLQEDGHLLACGRDRTRGREGALLLARSPGGAWRTLLAAGEIPGLDACRRAAPGPDGALAVAGLSLPGLALLREEGERWRLPSGWWAGAAAAPRLYDLAAVEHGWFAVGAGLVDVPIFLGPSGPEPLPLQGTAPEPGLVGDLWALASPDSGDTWLAGGRSLADERGAEAVLLRSPDAGRSWERVGLPPGLGWVRDLAFSRSGRCGLVIGQRDPADEGGFALVSSDGGGSWLELEGPLPGMHVAAVLEEGFLLGGDGGLLARGPCG